MTDLAKGQLTGRTSTVYRLIPKTKGGRVPTFTLGELLDFVGELRDAGVSFDGRITSDAWGELRLEVVHA